MIPMGKIDPKSRSVTLEKYLYAPADRVWDFLTNPAQVAAWFVPARIEPRVGGAIGFTFEDHEATGTILRYEPPRLLEFSWRSPDTSSSIVRIELTPDEDGCWLTLTHVLRDDGPIENFGSGWKHWLGRLGSLVAPGAGPVSTDWLLPLEGGDLGLRRTATYPTPGSHPCGLAFDGTGVWYSDAASEQIVRLSPEGEPVRWFTCPGLKSGLTFADDLLWQIGEEPRCLIGIDRVGRVLRKTPLPPPNDQLACGVAVKGGETYLAVKQVGEIQVWDLSVPKKLLTLPGCPRPGDLTLAEGFIWLADAHEGRLIRLNPSDGSRLTYAIGGNPTGVAFDGSTLWVNDYGMWRIDRYEPVRGGGGGASSRNPAADAGRR
jgi:uncharacterized protein YndB with AHSA1/START domain